MGASRAEGPSVKTLAPPVLENNKIISCKGPFSPFMGGFFSMGDLFSPYVENLLGLSTVRFTKLSVGAHGFATRVVPNMSFSQALYMLTRI